MIQSSDLSSTQSYLYKAKKGETFAMIKNFILKFLRLKKEKKKHQEKHSNTTVYISVTVQTLVYMIFSISGAVSLM